MAISKKIKRQIRGAYKSSDKTKRPKQTWSLRIGDLVEFVSSTGEDSHGVIVKNNGDGYYLVMSSTGSEWHKAVKLRCVEKAAHANSSQTKV